MVALGDISVLFLAEELRLGGAETYYYQLENNFCFEGFSFYSMAVDGIARDNLCQQNNFYTYSFGFINRIKRIVAVARNNSVDILHANSLQLAICAAVAKKVARLNCSIVYTKHNLTRLEKISKRLFNRFVNNNVDCLIAICESDEVAFIESGIDSLRVQRINNGVDLNGFPFLPHYDYSNIALGSVSVGMLARLSSEKRQDIFIEICKRIADSYPLVSFELGGDGPLREEVKMMVREANLSDRFRMSGYVQAEDYLKKIDYLFLVSDREVLPMSVIEAMATGCVVIARDVGGVHDIVTPETGYLIASDKPDDYFSVFEKSLLNDQRILLQRARRIVEESFSSDSALEKHRELYRELAMKLR